MDYYNMGAGPGIDAFFEGQKRAEDRATALSRMQLEEAQRQHYLQQMQQQQQAFPLEQEQRQQNLDLGRLTQQRTQGLISEEENKSRKEAADSFFKYLEEHSPNDVEEARLYSGVPPQFAQRYSSLTPEQRQQFIKVWSENKAKPEREKEAYKSKLRIQEQTAAAEAAYRKAQMQKQEDLTRAITVQKLRNEQALAGAQNKIAQMSNQSFQQRATALLREADQVRAIIPKTPEEEEAKQARLAELSDRIDEAVRLDFQAKVAGAMQRQAGQPDIGQLGGGQITTIPAPQPQVPSQMGQPRPSQYVPQQVYKGRTGTYQYLGGDPKNPASWKKVGP